MIHYNTKAHQAAARLRISNGEYFPSINSYNVDIPSLKGIPRHQRKIADDPKFLISSKTRNVTVTTTEDGKSENVNVDGAAMRAIRTAIQHHVSYNAMSDLYSE